MPVKSIFVEGQLYYRSLLKKYIDGTASEAEEADLLEELDKGEDTDEWTALIAELEVEVAAYDRRRWEPVLDELLQRIETGRAGAADTMVPARAIGMPAGQVRRLFFRRVAAAVLVGALIVTGLYTWRRQAKEAGPAIIAMTQDIAPGGQHAVLTLSNGQRILLDSAGNGRLGAQGGTNIIKTDSDGLRYDAGRLAAGAALAYNTLTTPRGGQFRLQLPDGTKVWLNTASSITYPTAFSDKDRKVQVTGEAYFEVAKDEQHPFFVEVGNLSIAVLGTSFNIHAYSDEVSINTTLLQGSVRVTRGQEQVVLHPGQQARAAASLVTVDGVDLSQTVAWKDGLFNFDGADLQSVMRQLGRWYDVDVVFQGEMPQRRFGGGIPMDLTLSQVLQLLGKMEVRFRIEGRKLIVIH